MRQIAFLTRIHPLGSIHNGNNSIGISLTSAPFCPGLGRALGSPSRLTKVISRKSSTSCPKRRAWIRSFISSASISPSVTTENRNDLPSYLHKVCGTDLVVKNPPFEDFLQTFRKLSTYYKPHFLGEIRKLEICKRKFRYAKTLFGRHQCESHLN